MSSNPNPRPDKSSSLTPSKSRPRAENINRLSSSTQLPPPPRSTPRYGDSIITPSRTRPPLSSNLLNQITYASLPTPYSSTILASSAPFPAVDGYNPFKDTVPLPTENDFEAIATKVEDTSVPIPDRKHGRQQKKGAMDPFEVRIRFTQHLQHLNASVTSANKAAQYALKYRDMDEDLHSCILEQLERNSMNNRANIMYFIEHLCDMASRENHPDYVRMMQRDILRIVDAVAPEDGSGAANVKVVRKVLGALEGKEFLLAQTVGEIEECLKERDTGGEVVGLSSPMSKDVEMGGMNGMEKTPKTGKTNGNCQKFDKKQIEQRIEEDRERHKRLREGIWAVPSTAIGKGQVSGGDDLEFEKLWEETSDVGEDDFDLYDEEKEQRKDAGKEWREEHRSRVIGSEA